MTPSIIYSAETKRWADEHEYFSTKEILGVAANAGVSIRDYDVARMENGIFIVAHDKQGYPVYAMTYNDKGETECALLGECEWTSRLRKWIKH